MPITINRLRNPAKLTCAWACSPATLSLSYYLINTQWSLVSGGSVYRLMQDGAGERPLRRFGDVFDLKDESQRNTLFRELLSLRPTDNLNDAIPPNQVRESRRTRPRNYPARDIISEFRNFIGRGWCTVGTGSHEYAIVCIFPHSKIINQGRIHRGPPISGWLAAYNPLSGVSYNTDKDDGELYYFEATGLLGTPIFFRRNINRICEIKPFRWKRIEHLYLARQPRKVPILPAGTTEIEEEEGAANKKFLLSDQDPPSKGFQELCRFPVENIQRLRRHCQPMAQRPISLFGWGPLVLQMFAGWLPTRSVPYPTAQEADGPTYNYLPVTQAQTNAHNYRTYLSGLICQVGSNYELTQSGVSEVRGMFADRARYQREAGATPRTAFPEYVAYIRYLLTYLETSTSGAAAITRLRNDLREDFEEQWQTRLREQAQDLRR